MRTVWLMLAICLPLAAVAESTLTGDLPRRDGKPLEEIAGVDSRYGVLEAAGGRRLRTILTRPAGTTGPLPAILFVQWLSCDSIELPAKQQDGWSRMLRRLAQESGMAMMRTEKAGVGDSEGDCAALDYETELADHRAALAALKRSPDVDPDRDGRIRRQHGRQLRAAGRRRRAGRRRHDLGRGREDLVRAHAGLRAPCQGVFSRAAGRTRPPHARARAVFCRLPDRSKGPCRDRARTAGRSPEPGSASSAPGLAPTTAGRLHSTSRRRRRTGRRPGRASMRPCSRSMASTTGSKTRRRTGSSPISRTGALRGGASLSKFLRPTTTSTGSRMPRRRSAARAASTTPTPRSA